ncbi:MAG: hypothetical protein ACR2PH_04070 [Desulfobulbia bacterium]
MKQTCDLPAPTLFSGRFNWFAKDSNPHHYWAWLRAKVSEQIPERKQLLQTGAATLLISCLFLAGSYMFLAQLAEYGW